MGDRLFRVLDEELSSLEADGSRVRGRSLLDMKGRQRPFPILDALVEPVEPVEGIGDGSIRGESGQFESPDNADALCVLGDPLDGVFGSIMVLLSGFACRWWSRSQCLSRDVSHFKRLTSALRRMRTEPRPRKWSVRNRPPTTVPLSTSWPQSSETYKRDRRCKKQTQDPVWEVTRDVCLVEEFPGGAVFFF